MEQVIVDYEKFITALKHYIANPLPGVDTYTAALRKATGNPNIKCEGAFRQQCKQMAYSAIYGTSVSFKELIGDSK